MDKPKKVNDHDAHNEWCHGYNYACDQWEKWLESTLRKIDNFAPKIKKGKK